MLFYLLDTVKSLSPEQTTLVVGAGKEQLIEAVPDASFVTQSEQLGTGHAARIAVDAHENFEGLFMVLFGDVPFIPKTIMETMAQIGQDPQTGLVVLGFTPNDPAKYGRLILDSDGNLERIVEYKDATESERAITLCNSGIMIIPSEHAKKWLHALSNDNAAGEYYLTDLVELARADNLKVPVVEADEIDVLGINTPDDLANAEKLMQNRQ